MVSIRPGVIVLVLEYQFKNSIESAVLLAGGKWVLIEDQDMGFLFDMEPHKKKNKTK